MLPCFREEAFLWYHRDWRHISRCISGMSVGSDPVLRNASILGKSCLAQRPQWLGLFEARPELEWKYQVVELVEWMSQVVACPMVVCLGMMVI